MNTKFIEREEIERVQKENKCGVKAALDIIAPWAGRFVRVCGGYVAFMYESDYQVWKNQK